MGQLAIPNATEVDVLFNSLLPPNNNDKPGLGRPFLSSTYIFIDNEQREFTIWPSQQTTDQNIVPVGPPQCNPASPVSTGGDIFTSSTGSPLQPSHPSAGTIAGATVGAVFGIALLGLACFLVLKKRRQGSLPLQRKAEGQYFLDALEGKEKDHSNGFWKAEMSADGHPLSPQELPMEGSPDYRTPLHEMSSASAPVNELVAPHDR